MLGADYHANIAPLALLVWLASDDSIVFIVVTTSIVAFDVGVAEKRSEVAIAIDTMLIILV